MTKRVQDLNRQLQAENSSHRVTTNIFNSFVRIQFNARIEREIFERQPARPISRRHSVNFRSAIIEQSDHEFADQSELPAITSAAESMSNDVPASAYGQASCSAKVIPLHRKRRAQSIDSAERQYIAPIELRSTIENLRRTLGKLVFTE